jgi:hypothetical protein
MVPIFFLFNVPMRPGIGHSIGLFLDERKKWMKVLKKQHVGSS